MKLTPRSDQPTVGRSLKKRRLQGLGGHVSFVKTISPGPKGDQAGRGGGDRKWKTRTRHRARRWRCENGMISLAGGSGSGTWADRKERKT